MARTLLGWSIETTAEKSGRNKNTVTKALSGGNVLVNVLRDLQTAFEKEGVIFGHDGSVRRDTSPQP